MVVVSKVRSLGREEKLGESDVVRASPREGDALARFDDPGFVRGALGLLFKSRIRERGRRKGRNGTSESSALGI